MQIALGGDSAGGNMTCVLAQKLRNKRGPKVALQIPLFPETGLPFATLAGSENRTGVCLDETLRPPPGPAYRSRTCSVGWLLYVHMCLYVRLLSFMAGGQCTSPRGICMQTLATSCTGLYLETARVLLFAWNLLPHDVDMQQPYVSPLNTENLSGLPPAVLVRELQERDGRLCENIACRSTVASCMLQGKQQL